MMYAFIFPVKTGLVDSKFLSQQLRPFLSLAVPEFKQIDFPEEDYSSIMKNTEFLGCILLKIQSCKLYNNEYMIASAQITSTEIFAFIVVLVFYLLSRKVLFINKKIQ